MKNVVRTGDDDLDLVKAVAELPKAPRQPGNNTWTQSRRSAVPKLRAGHNQLQEDIPTLQHKNVRFSSDLCKQNVSRTDVWASGTPSARQLFQTKKR